jgi:hypothetical protein
MGIWGYGPLENDDASDWLDELLEDQEFSLLYQAFDGVIGEEAEEYLETPECCNAIVAAEVVALLAGFPSNPSIVAACDIKKLYELLLHIKCKDKLVDQAIKSVEKIMTDEDNSELRQAWEEDVSGFESWTASLRDLVSRLKQAKTTFAKST